jgi:hypothetical protein
MSRGGRKRRDKSVNIKIAVPRKPSGRIRQQPEDAAAPGYWNKYKHGIRRQVMDRHYDSTLGELHFHGEITDSEFHVAIKYFLPIVENYDAVQEYRRTEKPLAYERVDKGQSIRDEDKDKAAVDKYHDAHAALVSAGLLAEKWTHEAVRDKYVPKFQVKYVKDGLAALVIHFKVNNS